MAKISVIGAGSWGSALAITFANAGHEVLLYSHHLSQVESMQQSHTNARYLPGITFPNALQVSGDLSATTAFASIILIAVPSHAFKECLIQLKPHWTQQHQLIWATKGLDESGQLLHTIVEKYLGAHIPKALLSGPSFALEVAEGFPTAVALASQDKTYVETLAHLLSHGNFRVYTTLDLIGAQLGGAVKNVLAIATGISDGLGFGANARAALITRGLAEMMRLGNALAAHPNTFMGLTGIGDLVLTCTDNKSRNRRYGLALGQGVPSNEITQNIGQVVEGIMTAHHVHALATKHAVEMPITEQVYRVLYEGLSPKEAVVALLNRPIKAE